MDFLEKSRELYENSFLGFLGQDFLGFDLLTLVNEDKNIDLFSLDDFWENGEFFGHNFGSLLLYLFGGGSEGYQREDSEKDYGVGKGSALGSIGVFGKDTFAGDIFSHEILTRNIFGKGILSKDILTRDTFNNETFSFLVESFCERLLPNLYGGFGKKSDSFYSYFKSDVNLEKAFFSDSSENFTWGSKFYNYYIESFVDRFESFNGYKDVLRERVFKSDGQKDESSNLNFRDFYSYSESLKNEITNKNEILGGFENFYSSDSKSFFNEFFGSLNISNNDSTLNFSSNTSRNKYGDFFLSKNENIYGANSYEDFYYKNFESDNLNIFGNSIFESVGGEIFNSTSEEMSSTYYRENFNSVKFINRIFNNISKGNFASVTSSKEDKSFMPYELNKGEVIHLITDELLKAIGISMV